MPPPASSRQPQRLRSERGQTIVEFALVLPLLLVLLFGIVNVAAAFNWWNDLNQIAGDGARLAAVNKSPATLCSDLKAKGDSAGLRSRMTVTISYPDGGASTAGNAVKVIAHADFPWGNFLPNFLGEALQSSLNGSATMRLEQNSSITTLSC